MKDDGYTLAEMLVAMSIIAMTIGGLVAASRIIGAQGGLVASKASQDATLQSAGKDFDALFEKQGPFSADDPAGFVGTADRLTFPCGDGVVCEAALVNSTRFRIRGPHGTHAWTLSGADRSHFLYIDNSGSHPLWPTESGGGRLRAVEFAQDDPDGAQPLIFSRLTIDQSPNCQFDAIVGKCRQLNP